MKKTLKYSLSFLAILSFLSCSKEKKSITKQNTSITSPVTKPFIWPDSIRNVFLVPDNIDLWSTDSITFGGNTTITPLLTPEEKELAQLIISTLFDNVIVAGNRLVLKMNRDDFIAEGIPEPYYDYIQERLENFNALEKRGVYMRNRSMEQVWEETQSSISRVLFAD